MESGPTQAKLRWRNSLANWPTSSFSQVMNPRLVSTSVACTLRSITLPERTASTLRITSLPQSQRAETSDGFEKQTAARAGTCCGVMCQTSLMLKERVQEGKDLECVRTLSEREDLHIYIEQKADQAGRQESAAQRQLKRTWKQESGKREVLIWLSMKSIENLSLKDWTCITNYVNENRARDCQGIEDLRKICCEETDRGRHFGMTTCLCTRRGPSSESHLLTQNQNLQNNVNSLSDARDFSILIQRAVLEHPAFQVNP